MDGNATAEASITPQWLPDSPKTGAPCGNWRTSAGGHFLQNHSLFEFVNAERLSDLIVSLLPRVLRQCALASPGQNRSTYQFAMDRSWSAPDAARVGRVDSVVVPRRQHPVFLQAVGRRAEKQDRPAALRPNLRRNAAARGPSGGRCYFSQRRLFCETMATLIAMDDKDRGWAEPVLTLGSLACSHASINAW